MDPAVSKLLDQRGGGYFKTLPSGKLLCSLNGYEVLPRVDALEQFMGCAVDSDLAFEFKGPPVAWG